MQIVTLKLNNMFWFCFSQPKLAKDFWTGPPVSSLQRLRVVSRAVDEERACGVKGHGTLWFHLMLGLQCYVKFYMWHYIHYGILGTLIWHFMIF